MKKMKKSGWIAAIVVAVAILTTVGLVIGCRPAVGPTGETGSSGNIRMNFGYTKDAPRSRTVLPDDAKIGDFKVIWLQFFRGTDTSDPATAVNVYLNVTGTTSEFESIPFPMKSGDWTVLATGYIDGGPVTYANPCGDGLASATKVAGWWNGSIHVNGTNTSTFPYEKIEDPVILLRGDTGKTGNGNFQWAITNSVTGGDSALTTATMTATLTDGGGGFPEVNLKDNDLDTPNPNWAGITNLAPGFYYLDFEFEQSGADPIYFRHVMQIYPNLTSKFIYELTDDYFYLASVDIVVYIDFKPPTDPEFAPLISATGMLTAADTTYDVAYQAIEMTSATTSTVAFTVSAPTGVSYASLSYTVGNVADPTPMPIAANAFTLGAAAPFTTAGRYLVTVTGVVDPNPGDPNEYTGAFSTSFMVMVSEEP